MPQAHVPPATDRRFHRGVIPALALLAGLLSALIPFLPVVEHTTTHHWDSAHGAAALPLAPYRPASLTIVIDARATHGVSGVLVDTVASNEARLKRGRATLVREREALIVTSGAERVVVEGAWPASTLQVDFSSTGIVVSRDGAPVAVRPGDLRPTLDGFSHPSQHLQRGANAAWTADTVTEPADATPPPTGLTATVVADTQWDSSPTALKSVAILGAFAAWAALVVLVARGERSHDSRAVPSARPPLAPVWDAVFLGSVTAGIVMGGATDDDGYITRISQTLGASGYVGNHVRWVNAPEAPFGWHYYLTTAWATISREPVWLRILPAFVALAGWWVISHRIWPRLSTAPTRAGGLFLTAAAAAGWLVFGNSLRPEVWFATGTAWALWWVLVAEDTGRLLPLAGAASLASLTAGTGPVGVIAFVPVVLGVVRHLRTHPNQPVTTCLVILTCAGLAVPLMFLDQTWASVREANAARTAFGPIYPLSQDWRRYLKLVSSPLPRQAFTYAAFVATSALAVVWWRRTPTIRREVCLLVAVTAVTLVPIMAVSPTKLAHHFGALLWLGPLAGAAVVDACARDSLERWSVGLMPALGCAALAASLHGGSAWWRLSSAGLPEVNLPMIQVAGLMVASAALVFVGSWWAWPAPRNRTRLAWAISIAAVGCLGVLYAAFGQAALQRGPHRYTFTSAAWSAVSDQGCLLERSLIVGDESLADLATRESVATGWDMAYFTPCLAATPVIGATATIPHYLLDTSPHPGNMSFESKNGGTWAGVTGWRIPRSVPLRSALADDDPTIRGLRLTRLDRPTFDTGHITTERGSRVRQGWTPTPVVVPR